MEIPDGFATIEPGLYRARSGPEYSFSFLASLGLKTLIVLDSATPSRSLSDFAKENGIKLVHLVTESWRSIHDVQQARYTADILSKALKYALDNRNYPLMVLGTNLLTGVIRRLENLSLFAVLSDYNIYSEVPGVRTNSSGSVFLEFLEFTYRDVDAAEPIYSAQDTTSPLPYLVCVDLPEDQFRPDWARRFQVAENREVLG